MSLHSDLQDTNLHQAFHYEQDADPGAVGPGKYWLDTNSGPPLELWRRNSIDTAWEQVGGGGGGSAFSGGKIYLNAAPQSITNNTNTAIIFDTELWDTDGYINIGGQPTRLTAPDSGYYDVGAMLSWGDGGGVDTRQILIKKNGTDFMGKTFFNGAETASLHFPLLLTAADYIEVIVRQVSGGSVDISQDGDEISPVAWMTKLGDL